MESDWCNFHTELNEKQADGILTESPFDCEIISEITTIAVLHHEIHIMLWFLAVKQSHHVLMVQLRQLLEYFDFLAQKILRLCQALLGDALYGHRKIRFLKQSEK